MYIKDTCKQKRQRENDVFIMDKIYEIPRPKHIVETLNDVMLWLKVSRLSDIYIREGTTIE